MFKVTIVIAVLVACSAQRPPRPHPSDIAVIKDAKCQDIMKNGCPTTKHDGPLCGSDGQTYPSHCDFAKATCQDDSLTYQWHGSCEDGRPTRRPRGTAMPGRGGRTHPPLECAKFQTMTCPSMQRPVCGSDEKTYDNMCYFGKAICNNEDLKVKWPGTCENRATRPPRGRGRWSHGVWTGVIG